MTQLKNGTMVVVADSEKALFAVNLTDGENPNFDVIRVDEEDNPPDREQTENRRGRVQQSAANGGHAYDETDFHELQKDRFAADLADKLYKLAHKGAFETLVLVASPHVLGVLRSELHKEVSDKVIGEIPKTLTNHRIGEIETLVKQTLADAA